MRTLPGILRRLRLRHVVFFVLLLSGIIPLLVSSGLLIWQNRQILKGQEEDEILRATNSLSREVDDYLRDIHRQLFQLGGQLLAFGPRDRNLVDHLLSAPVEGYLGTLMTDNPSWIALRVLNPEGLGINRSPANLAEPLDTAFVEVYEQAREGETTYRFLVHPETEDPTVAVAVPVSLGAEEPQLVVGALVQLRRLDLIFRRETQGQADVLLLDPEAQLLWFEGADADQATALAGTELMRDLARLPINIVTPVEVPGGEQMLARVSQVPETGWLVVVLRPLAAAFQAVDEMVFKTILSSLLVVVLALLFAWLAARRVSQPIQRLAQTSHEIAGGNFGGRVATAGLLFELADLGEDFNRMSGHVERYVDRLQLAARENRELFIGSLRAFAAAIDAKDPYTRGHSERVAKISRILARHVGLSEEMQEKIWIAAVLHDVGKIGVEDRVLRKVGRLEPEEFEQMKRHTVIGAEIMGPIVQLADMIPVIRWHHENWNGRGYPDGLRGEEIPLSARIVAVADTFDAVTTTRPYQQAYTLEFAVETITRLTGSRFDAKVVTAFLGAYEKREITVVTDRSRRIGEQAAAARGPREVEDRVLSMT
jgi:HD-GYP domain-containing protein (c-di-GMP phosphodiesterase class II)